MNKFVVLFFGMILFSGIVNAALSVNTVYVSPKYPQIDYSNISCNFNVTGSGNDNVSITWQTLQPTNNSIASDTGDVAIDGSSPSNGDDITTHGWFNTLGSTYSNSQVYDGALSIYSPGVSSKYNYYYFPQNYTTGNYSLQFWMYDDGDASSGTESVGVYGTRTVDGAKVHAQLGMYGNRGGSNNYYSFTNGLNCGGTSGTFSTGIAKTVGWHRMRINVDLNNFIIRTQIDSNAIQNWDTSSCTYKFDKIIGLFIHQQDAAGNYQSVYYDDVVFWKESFNGYATKIFYTPQNNYTFVDIADGLYKYYVTIFNTGGFSNSTMVRYITLDTTPPIISFNGSTEVNNAYVNATYVYSSVSIDEDNFNHSAFKIYNGSVLLGSFNDTASSHNWTAINDGYYNYSVTVVDDVGLSSTVSRNITLDNVAP